MKVLEKKYPKGTFKGQKTDGRYVDRMLFDNLKLLATKITNDMTFLGICFSSTLEVGTGKSVLCTQIGEIWPELMKEIHNKDVPFDMKHVVFRPEDLIERAFKVPQYSCILLDEWEDAHYWSKLGMTLRKFFRKCRQLNLFILAIIPNFFELPRGYAISRSIFAIDVKFDDNLDRGNYDFYGFKAKKKLYMRGKKEHDYDVQAPDFQGEFFDGYGVPEKEYRRLKRIDMEKYDEEDKKPLQEVDFKAKFVKQILDNSSVSQAELARWLGISQPMIVYLLKKIENNKEKATPSLQHQPINTYNSIQVENEMNLDEGLDGEEEKENDEPIL